MMLKPKRKNLPRLFLIACILAFVNLVIWRSMLTRVFGPRLMSFFNGTFVNPTDGPSVLSRRHWKIDRERLKNGQDECRVEIHQPYLKGEHLARIPYPLDTTSLKFENGAIVCSDTCYMNACGSNPDIHSGRWFARDLGCLQKLPRLRRLHFCNIWLGKDFPEALARCDSLESLFLDRCDFEDTDLPQLSQIKRLRELRFCENYLSVNRKGVWIDPAWVADLKSITEIQLVEAKDSGVIAMAQMLPLGCRLILRRQQYDKLSRDPMIPIEIQARLATRSDDALGVYSGY
jgi:hypothetical protein